MFPTSVNGAASPFEWADRGLCRAHPEFDWALDEAAEASAECRELCRRCPVRVECLVWALEAGENGVWAGTTRSQRNQLRSLRLRVKCPACLSALLIHTEGADVCAGCGVSWPVKPPKETRV